jgi:hypothetical protein
MWTLRKAMALLGIAVILLTALLPVAALLAIPLVVIGWRLESAGQAATRPLRRSAIPPIRRALAASRHLPRASLSPEHS